MENQHQKITGYRELSQAEIDLMNKIKAHAIATATLAREVKEHVQEQRHAATAKDDSLELSRLTGAAPDRWVAIGITDFQTGFMALTRAVAQPTTF